MDYLFRVIKNGLFQNKPGIPSDFNQCIESYSRLNNSAFEARISCDQVCQRKIEQIEIELDLLIPTPSYTRNEAVVMSF